MLLGRYVDFLLKTKIVPLVLSYCKTLSVGPIPGLEPVTPALQLSVLMTELVLLR